jgi:hypothetical protein
MAGNFSKNLSVTSPVKLPFRNLPLATLLFPFLEDFVLREATPTGGHDKRPITLEGFDPFSIRGDYDFIPGTFEIKGNLCKGMFDVTSIARPARPNDCIGFPDCDRYHKFFGDLCVHPPDPDLLMVREIRMSKPDTWWLFTPVNAGSYSPARFWFLLNYKEKKMFKEGDMANGLVWDDSWDQKNWRRYKLRKSARIAGRAYPWK